MKKIFILLLISAIASAFTWDNADVIGLLKKNVVAFNSLYQRKKIDLLFSQPKYAPGDTALVRVLYLTASTRQLVTAREIIYIEIFDASGKSTLREKIAVEKGWASNRLVLPASMTPGLYQVVAWSDWMKNFDSSLFFKQDLVIAGSKAIKKSFGPNEGKLDIFPEGGALIAGVKNNVVIHYNGDASRKLVSILNGEAAVTTAAFDQNGLAEVTITPESGSTLQAVSSGSDGRRFPFPAAKTDGFAINVTNPQASALNVHVEAAGAVTKAANEYFLVCTSAAEIVYYDRLTLDGSNSASITLPGSMASGVVQVSIIDANLNVWANRAISISQNTNFNTTIQPSAKTLTTRSNVSADVEIRDAQGARVNGYFSVRVLSESVFKDSIQSISPTSNLTLYSDISSTFRIDENSGKKEILRYLVTQTCPWLPWTKINSGTAKPEFARVSNPSLSGRVIQIETGKPVQDSTDITFFVEKQMIGYEEAIMDDGKFDFPLLFDFYGPDEIFYAATRKGRDVKNVRVVLNKQLEDSSFSFPGSAWKTVEREDPYGKYAFQKNVIDRSFTFYSGKTATRDSIVDKNIYFEKELQGADIIFKTTDYVIFPNMIELVREVLKAVDYRKMKGQDVVRVYTTNRQLPTPYVTPLFVIDGVFTKNATTFMNLVPSDIITIKIIRNSNKLTKLGDLGAHGVIMVWTKKQEASERLRPENVFPVTGVTIPLRKKRDASPKRNDQVPDLRPSLGWGENIATVDGAAKFQFTTGDDTGTFKILIDGVTTEGVPFSKEEVVTVKYEAQP